jgi:hypothetical protein
MTNPETPQTEPQPSNAEYQFGLQAFLWMFVVVAVFLSYIRMFGPLAVAHFGFVATLALLLGGLIGWLSGRFSAAVFWSGIGVVGGYLAVVHTCLNHKSDEYVWPLSAGLVGATAAACGDGNVKRRMICCSLVWLGLVSIYEIPCFGFQRELIFDPICATLAGALAGLGVDLASRFEKYTSIPRHIFALGLILLAIAGHSLTMWCFPKLW